MTDLETILEMIREVSPTNEKKLKEINLRVAIYINHPLVAGLVKHYEEKPLPGYSALQHALEHGYTNSSTEFTTSRSALKAIRPEGWHFDIYDCTEQDMGFKVVGFNKECVEADGFPTEELAELYVILQAIDYIRNNP